MSVRPSVPRSARNPGRRAMPSRMPLNEVNRPLLRQLVRTRRSDPCYKAYILEVREVPAVDTSTDAAAGKSIIQPWVTARDSAANTQSIGLPVSICDTLLKHLLTCVVSEEATHPESSENSESDYVSPEVNTDAQSPIVNSDVTKSAVEETTTGENSSPKRSSSNTHSKVFQLSQLKPIRIVCEATGCILEVTARNPLVKRQASIEEQEQPVPIDPSRRWIVSAPVESRTSSTSAGEHTTGNTASVGRRKHPWETRGVLELHENLMPQFSGFLTDVVTRYRSVNQLPEVRSLYSASGERRFFFDLRDTRWGKRLHISQVTDLHRNVIGIPLEALVSFRTRLDMIIHSLGLEDQHVLRSEISKAVPDASSPRRQRGAFVPQNMTNSYEIAHVTSNSTRNAGRDDMPTSARQRGRERNRQRVRSYTSALPTRGSMINNPRSAPTADYAPESGTRSQMNGRNQWNENVPRTRRFLRRNRYLRAFHSTGRTPTDNIEPQSNESAMQNVQTSPKAVIDRGRVAAVAEASA